MFWRVNKNKLDLLFVFFIAIFSSILVYFLINANNNLGIYCSDVFIYLTNSLHFAGYNIGKSSTLYLSPVICFITSLIFRAGFIDQTAIFTVTGVFFPIASIGVYFLIRLKLNEIMSLFGAILFSSFSLNILWAANGSLDIPAVAFSIWTIYFAILAIDRNPKYFLLSFPIFVLGFFTRYTVGFILPIIALYILFNIDIFNNTKERLKVFTKKKLILKRFKDLITSKNFKYFVIGVIIALILFSSVLMIINRMGSDLTFITQAQDAVSGDKGSSIDPGFNPAPYFYLTNLPNFISSENIGFKEAIPVLYNPSILSYFILGIILISGLVYILDKTIKKQKKRKYKKENKNKKDKNDIKNVLNRNTKIISVFIISIIIIFTYKGISSIISEILFLINILLIFNILNTNINSNNENNKDNKDNKNKNISFIEKEDIITNKETKTLNLNLLMISWFFIYLIFFSFSDVKVDRYFITVLPVIAYFAAYSLDFLIKTLTSRNFINRNDKNHESNDENINDENGQNNKDNENYDNNTKNTNKKIIQNIVPILLIILFIGSAFANIEKIPTENNLVDEPIVISQWLMNYDPNYNNSIIWVYNVRYYTWYLKMNVIGAYEKDIPKLEKNNVTYYISKNISKENYTIANYTIIKKFDDVYIYKRNT